MNYVLELHLFFAGSNSEIMEKIKIFKMNPYPDYFSNEIKDLLGKLIRISPNDRITIQEVKNHPWIVKNVKIYCDNLLH